MLLLYAALLKQSLAEIFYLVRYQITESFGPKSLMV